VFDARRSEQCVLPGPGSLLFKGFRESEDTEVVAVPADDLHADGQPVDCSGPWNRHCGVPGDVPGVGHAAPPVPMRDLLVIRRRVLSRGEWQSRHCRGDEVTDGVEEIFDGVEVVDAAALCGVSLPTDSCCGVVRHPERLARSFPISDMTVSANRCAPRAERVDWGSRRGERRATWSS
jgi:hypothetical protein